MPLNSAYEFNSRFEKHTKNNQRSAFVGKKLLGVILGFLAILVSLQLFLANYLSTKGQEVQELETRKKAAEEENLVLKVEIAKLSSLSSITQRAGFLGFKRNSEFSYPAEVSSLALKN